MRLSPTQLLATLPTSKANPNQSHPLLKKCLSSCWLLGLTSKVRLSPKQLLATLPTSKAIGWSNGPEILLCKHHSLLRTALHLHSCEVKASLFLSAKPSKSCKKPLKINPQFFEWGSFLLRVVTYLLSSLDQIRSEFAQCSSGHEACRKC